MKYKSIFISDTHLGTRGAQANALNNFLKKSSCEQMYLVGDIIDGWRLKKKWYWPQSHSNVIRRIIGCAKRGTKVYWVLGNHDEMLRSFLDLDMRFGRIKVVNEIVHQGVDGKSYLVIHGDLFDGITSMAKWLVRLGDKMYDFLLWFNQIFNKVRRVFGYRYWSLSAYLKLKTKNAVDYLWNFKHNVTNYAKHKKLDGVICGHIHTPEIETIEGITYMNDGDWVESCTALVEHFDGSWEIINWTDKIHEKNTTD